MMACVISLKQLSRGLFLVRCGGLMEAALFRTESRGGHFRTDCPSAQPFWQRHTVQTLGQGIGTAPLADALSD